MKPLLFSLLFFCSCMDIYAQAVQAKVLQLEKNRFKAMINKDSLFLTTVLSNELLYIHSNGAQDSKETFIRNISSGNLQYFSIDLQQVDIRTNNQTAWIHGVAKVKVRSGISSDVVELLIRYLDIYRREDGEWKLIAWQSAKLN